MTLVETPLRDGLVEEIVSHQWRPSIKQIKRLPDAREPFVVLLRGLCIGYGEQVGEALERLTQQGAQATEVRQSEPKPRGTQAMHGPPCE